jgi:hypothetical protein
MYNPKMPSPSSHSRLNTRFIVRGFLVGLALLIPCLAVSALLPAAARRSLYFTIFPLPNPEPTPLPPVITVPRGPLPPGPVGLQEWRHDADGGTALVGSGFLLRLPDGAVVGVTTAHSLDDLGRADSPLSAVSFGPSGAGESSVEFDLLFGVPGTPRTGWELEMDCVLFGIPDPAGLDPAWILAPDDRALPQPGERVTLYSGLGDGKGVTDARSGTVQSAAPEGVWVLMDEVFDAGRMSGSPLISRHTGRVVGMAVAVSPRRSRILIGLNPIGALLERAAAADGEFPIAGYRR